MRFSERHWHYLFLAFALLLATLVAALGGTSFQRKVESFQPIGFTAEAHRGRHTLAGCDEEPLGS